MLMVSNAEQPGHGFSTTFWIQVGPEERYFIHGLTPLASVSHDGLRTGPEGRPCPTKTGFLEDHQHSNAHRFDPELEPKVTLDLRFVTTSKCALRLVLPAGAELPIGTNLAGCALRTSDQARFKLHLDPLDARSFGGDGGLPSGEYSFYVTTTMPPEYEGYFARGKLVVPCAGTFEQTLERGVSIRGQFVDEGGAAVMGHALRFGFADAPAGTTWGSLWPEKSGRFAHTGLPPGSTLVIEGTRETIPVGMKGRTDVVLLCPSR
jgi:hypothetical protein